MSRLFLGIALAAFILMPLEASAQQAPIAPSQSQPPVEGTNAGKLVAIGVGVIAGVAVAQTLGVVDTMSLLGGALGGYLAAWWYDSSYDSMHMQMNMRQRTSASAPSPPKRLALSE